MRLLQLYFYSYDKIVECGLHLLGSGNIYTVWVLSEREGRLGCDEWRLLGAWARIRGEEVITRDQAGGAHNTRVM